MINPLERKSTVPDGNNELVIRGELFTITTPEELEKQGINLKQRVDYINDVLGGDSVDLTDKEFSDLTKHREDITAYLESKGSSKMAA